MAALRKMLGDINSSEVKEMMSLIETQSKQTLINWAVSFAKERYLPIYQKYGTDDRLAQILAGCEAYQRGELKLAEAKQLIRESREIASLSGENPVMQASARAVSTALSTVNTITSSLGFLFYGAAAIAYNTAGLKAPHASREEYDRIATEEILLAIESLKRVAVQDEPNPAKIDWCC